MAGVDVYGEHMVGFQMRREVHGYFFCLSCVLDRLDRPPLIATHELEPSIDNHLRCINASKSKQERMWECGNLLLDKIEGLFVGYQHNWRPTRGN